MTDVLVKRLREDAHIPGQAYAGDAGLDLVACDGLTLEPGERAVIGTGIAVAIPEGYAGLVVPRSGLAASHGLTIVNAPGLIDSGYRGEILVIVLNTDADARFVVAPGMRVAQLLVVPVSSVRLVVAQALPETERGEGGLGSSGLT